MAKLQRLAGSTSHVLEVFVQDSSSTTGAGLAGLTNASGSLTCYYKRNTGGASAAVTLDTIVTLGTYGSYAAGHGGFKEVDAVNMTGVYEFQPPDAAYASGAKSVVFMLKGAANMAPVLLEIELTAVDNQANSFGLVLVKGTSLTGLNDIAATAIVSGGAITTSGGAVSTVATVSNGVGIGPGAISTASFAAGAIDAAAVAASALNGKGDWLLAIGYTAPPTTAAIATAVWTDTTAGDFATASSPGKILVTQLGGAFTTAASSVYSTASLVNAPTGGSAPTVIQIRQEIDTNSTQLAAIKAKTDNLPANPAAVGSAMVLSSAGLDAIMIETGVNARQALSPILAACAGVLAGAGTGTITIKAGNVPATTRITATTDGSGNRSAVTLALPT